jgi:hypothetical protein
MKTPSELRLELVLADPELVKLGIKIIGDLENAIKDILKREIHGETVNYPTVEINLSQPWFFVVFIYGEIIQAGYFVKLTNLADKYKMEVRIK